MVFNTRGRMSVFNHILLSHGVRPYGTIAVNVTWIEREFNACQTHYMYTPIFNRLRSIARYWSEMPTFSYPLHLTPPYRVAPGTKAVNITRLEREFNAIHLLQYIYRDCPRGVHHRKAKMCKNVLKWRIFKLPV